VQLQLARCELGDDAGELRMGALAEEGALRIDEHPLPVPLEAGGAQAHARAGERACGFQRVHEQS
jgi:hypothetical protein